MKIDDDMMGFVKIPSTSQEPSKPYTGESAAY